MKSINTILIVDDDVGARNILEALLAREGHRLEFAVCGREALEKVQHLTPSLVLLDVMMPEMDGFEVCRQLRAMPRLAEVPIIIITALDDKESRLEGIHAGADDFLSKPFDREELRARVRTILRLNRYRRLHAEREKFEWVIQHANNGYVIINQDDDVLYANSHARLYLNLPHENVARPSERESGRAEGKFLELIRPMYRAEPQEAWRCWPDAPEDGAESLRYLVRPETPTSESFWLQVEVLDVAASLDDEKLIRLTDVTSNMKAQRNRWGFHTIICHKLRTPLVGILGSMEFLSQQVEHLTTAEILEFVQMSYASVRRLHGEIEDVLQYLSAPGMVHADPMPFSELSKAISRMADSLHLTTIQVTVAPPAQDVWLMLSQRAIELIFLELLENSVKFHPTHAPNVTVDVTFIRERTVGIRFADDGVTLSPGQLSQMWMPYYQGEKYLTGEEEGMGLGLAMVSSMIWEVGGTCQSYNQQPPPGIAVELTMPFITIDDIKQQR